MAYLLAVDEYNAEQLEQFESECFTCGTDPKTNIRSVIVGFCFNCGAAMCNEHPSCLCDTLPIAATCQS